MAHPYGTDSRESQQQSRRDDPFCRIGHHGKTNINPVGMIHFVESDITGETNTNPIGMVHFVGSDTTGKTKMDHPEEVRHGIKLSWKITAISIMPWFLLIK
ncbi:hypothetical protein DUE52_15410 [Larkinella punicea]|uniref:Uncharacterized protein n=1 Tax=Larkinella punicea TaxID=2315727 RepID=A0A368JPE0_9BACT|nr:hypothetical protein DUE52_15410 [Larkinella punicea]